MKKQNLVKIGERIRNARKQLELSMADMAAEGNVSPSYIGEFERGNKPPSAKFILYLHETHRVNLNYIFGSSTIMFTDNSSEKYDFGNEQALVNQMMAAMDKFPFMKFRLLAEFEHLKMSNPEIAKQISG